MSHELPDGLIYRVSHMRLYKAGDPSYPGPLPHGGTTVVQIGRVEKMSDGETVFTPIVKGSARCSKLDNYCKKRGRDIALGRALKQLTT